MGRLGIPIPTPNPDLEPPEELAVEVREWPDAVFGLTPPTSPILVDMVASFRLFCLRCVLGAFLSFDMLLFISNGLLLSGASLGLGGANVDLFILNPPYASSVLGFVVTGVTGLGAGEYGEYILSKFDEKTSGEGGIGVVALLIILGRPYDDLV